MMKSMMSPDSQGNSLYDNQGLSFSLKKTVVQQVFIVVFAIHLIVFFIALVGLPNLKIPKRPDITIELGAAPEASDGAMNSTKPKAQEISKEVSKERNPPLKKDKDGLLKKSQVSSNIESSSSVQSGGTASAPTIDADYRAAYLQNPKPPYPPLAYRLRIEGKVILLAEVLPNGQSGSVSIIESSGNEMLDLSALETVKKWKFTPARKDGVIVTQAVRIPITFSLKNR